MNKLIKKLVLGLLMVLISTTDIELYAYAYYNGFAFESSGLWSTEIATKDGWEEVTGLRLVGSASFVEKLNYGLPYMENNTELVIPEYVEDNDGRRAYVGSIGRYVFKNSGYTIAYIPNHVSLIEEGAFIGCRSLKTVIFGKNLKHIGYSPFHRESLEDVYFLGCEPPTLADCFSRSTTIHVPEKALGTYMDNRYFGQRDLTIVGMSDAEISKIEAEMRSKDEYRHKRWVDYVLELKRELPRFEYHLKNRGNSDVYEYIKTFRDPKAIERERKFIEQLTEYNNKFEKLLNDKLKMSMGAKCNYTELVNNNRLLRYISSFAKNIPSTDLKKYFVVSYGKVLYGTRCEGITIDIESTKDTKKLYDEFWNGIRPYLNLSTYRVKDEYQTPLLGYVFEELSFEVLSRILNELQFVESLGNPYASVMNKIRRRTAKTDESYSKITYTFSVEHKNAAGQINLLGSKRQALKLFEIIKSQLPNINATSESEIQQLKDYNDNIEKRFLDSFSHNTLQNEGWPIYQVNLSSSKYSSYTQYGQKIEDTREDKREDFEFEITQPKEFVNGAEFIKFCGANDFSFEDKTNIIFGCPLIQGGFERQTLYHITTPLKPSYQSGSFNSYFCGKKIKIQ